MGRKFTYEYRMICASKKGHHGKAHVYPKATLVKATLDADKFNAESNQYAQKYCTPMVPQAREISEWFNAYDEDDS